MSVPVDTKSRILDVAEQLFARDGLDRVSIRDITDGAGVNLAAVNYHFGGKDELIAAVFERRLKPLNSIRIEEVERVVREAGDRAPKVEAVLEALIRPTVQCCTGQASRGNAFEKLIGRCLAEPGPEIEALLRRQFDPLVEVLNAAFLKACPHLSRTEIFWRMKFTFGALHHWLLTHDRFLPPWAEETARAKQMDKLIAFAAAGFKAK
jgi:AcrR family transcriptional regulator